MLPKRLLVVDRERGHIKPKYLSNTTLSEQVLGIFNDHLNRKYKALNQAIKILEHGNSKYKIIRGLSEIIERNSTFKLNTELNPQDVRTFLFEHGFVINEEERKSVLLEASDYFDTSVEDIENAIFADLPKEQVLEQIPDMTPLDLIKEYNLSQTQTLLFNASELVIKVEGNYKELFRMINYLGLMYEISGKEIKVTGPGGLFKKTRKYGTRFAKLIPYIINTLEWVIKAKIEMKWGNKSKIYDFKLTSSQHPIFPDYSFEPPKFDSEVEKQFYSDFKNFLPKWEIKREPTFIKAGNYVIIPDFGFYRFGLEIFMEVVGFWTPSYLKKKITKFNQTDKKIIAAVNKNLKCSKKDFPGEVIFYDKTIPIKPIINKLRTLEEREIEKQKEKLGVVTISEDIIEIEEKAQDLNIPPDVLKAKEFPNFHIIGDKLVSKEFLGTIKNELGEKRDFSEIKPLLDKYQLTDKVLDLLGFKIIWDGLKPVKIAKKY